MAGASPPAVAAPTGFSDTIIWNNLVEPTALAFAPDGKVFVGQKSGVILEFDSPADTTPQVFADLQSTVFNGWDRGLLGMTVDPGFGTAGHNFVYVLYTRDAKPNGPTPAWNDNCPGPPNGPGPNTDGCRVTGTLSRLPWNGGTAGPEQVLIQNEWCQQYPSHSMGTVAFGADGSLYVSAGDGASFDWQDFGQGGGTVLAPGGQPYTPVNPCGDPPGGVGNEAHLANGDGRFDAIPERAPSGAVPADARRSRPSRRPGDWRGTADQPDGIERRSRTSVGSLPTDSATRSGSRQSGHGASYGSGTSAS